MMAVTQKFETEWDILQTVPAVANLPPPVVSNTGPLSHGCKT